MGSLEVAVDKAAPHGNGSRSALGDITNNGNISRSALGDITNNVDTGVCDTKGKLTAAEDKSPCKTLVCSETELQRSPATSRQALSPKRSSSPHLAQRSPATPQLAFSPRLTWSPQPVTFLDRDAHVPHNENSGDNADCCNFPTKSALKLCPTNFTMRAQKCLERRLQISGVAASPAGSDVKHVRISDVPATKSPPKWYLQYMDQLREGLYAQEPEEDEDAASGGLASRAMPAARGRSPEASLGVVPLQSTPRRMRRENSTSREPPSAESGLPRWRG